MSLSAGARLGPYEILAPLGAGGMGEVYKSRDTRLNRTVAIKVLPPEFAADPDLRSRFEREARAVSSLDHPNICVLHDVGRESAGPGQRPVEFLVMQYLEGETLAARLARGPLPLADALRHATEIASALDRAHRAGILHRDLKPSNVMLTKSGAKLLDFGLAKVAAAPVVGDAQTADKTATTPLTGKGTILGTLQYMSPEQLEGRDADARSDIFSFGAMLYEMVTATRPFEGNSQAGVIAAILDRDPVPMSERAPLTPPALDRVVRKCLAKDPDRRWQSAADLCDELSWISQSSGLDIAPRPRALPTPSWRRWAARGGLAAVALLLGILLGWLAFGGRSAPATFSRHTTIAAPDGVAVVPGGIAISPDGRTVAYVAAAVAASQGAPSSSSRIYLRRFDTNTTTALSGTEEAKAPFFSPDGLWIGYFTSNALMKISVLGGAPIKILDVPPVTRGAAWGPDNMIVLSPTQGSALARIDAAGMNRGITGLMGAQPKNVTAQLWPSLLPDGSAVIFTRRRSTAGNLDDADIVLQDIKTGEQTQLLSGGGYARYSPSGHLLFVRGGTLLAAPFDVRVRKVTGTPLPIAEDIAVDASFGGAHYALASDGTLLYLRGSFGAARYEAMWVERTGKATALPSLSVSVIANPRLSSDGSRALMVGVSPQGDADIFLMDVSRPSLIRLTTDRADDFAPVWIPDGSKIIYSTFNVGSLPSVVMQPVNGGVAERLVPVEEPQFGSSVSPEGVLAYTIFRDDTRADIHVVPLSADRKARPFVSTAADEYGAEFSPDGRWIAYMSNESGTYEIYVVPYPGPGPRRLVSRGGGVSPKWCDACAELFYQSTGGMMSVPIKRGPEPSFGEPHLLFGGSYFVISDEDGHRNYDVTRDGRRFLMLRQQHTSTRPPSLEVVLDWPARLRGASSPRSEP